MKVAEWMVTELVTVGPNAEVAEAVRLMREHRIRHLPVVEKGRLVGLVTASDLRELTLPSMVETIRLGEVMIREPVTVSPEAHIDEAARTIYERKIGGLPVVEGRRLVGILTVTDILKAFIDIMGVLAASSRLDVRLAERPGAFEEVSAVITGHGAEIMSVAIHGRPGPKIYFFRLARCNVEPIVRDLERRGHTVTAAMD